jgi:hypothetical protein
MERREKIKQLEAQRDKELGLIYDKYKAKFDELKYTFNIDELLKDGWIKSNPYYIRGNKDEWEYMKKMPNHKFWTMSITVDFDEKGSIRQIFTYSGCSTRTICDMEDLNYYFENNK